MLLVPTQTSVFLSLSQIVIFVTKITDCTTVCRPIIYRTSELHGSNSTALCLTVVCLALHLVYIFPGQ